MKKGQIREAQGRQLVIILDERGARCVSRVPRKAEVKGFEVESHDDLETVLCRKAFNRKQGKDFSGQVKIPPYLTVDFVEDLAGRLDVPIKFRKPDKIQAGGFDRNKKSRLRERSKKAPGKRRTENAKFNLARRTERALAPQVF